MPIAIQYRSFLALIVLSLTLLTMDSQSFARSTNTTKNDGSQTVKPQYFYVPALLEEKTHFESSGAVYLADLNKYLIISDDTDENNTPWLFYSTPQGEIEEEPLLLPGVTGISDMESISFDGRYIYIMSSLGMTKKGNSKLERNLFVQIERSQSNFRHIKTLNLGKILRNQILISKNPVIAELKPHLDVLEVEGHSVYNNTLYIAIKTPLLNDHRALVVSIPNLDLLEENTPLDVLQVTALVTFESTQEMRISDLAIYNSRFYLTTTCIKNRCGALWEAEKQGLSHPNVVRFFNSDRPEGVTVNQEKQMLFLTFDEGDKKSKYLNIPLDLY